MAEKSNLRIFTGNSNSPLAKKVADVFGLPLGKIDVGHFRDGEIMVEIKENVRGRDIYLIQSTCAPVNDNLMEMIIMADAFRRASAASVTAVVPYFGYARQDRRVRSARVPITAKVVADIMASVGISRMITVDLHADQIQGFFDMPVDNIYASMALLEISELNGLVNPTVVSPDVGGVVRARAIAKRMNDTDLAIIDKRRPSANEIEVMNVIGDVADRDCILVDDIVDTAGTLCKAAQALRDQGARRVIAYCTHAVLSGSAVSLIEESTLDEVVVSDSIPLSEAAEQSAKIRQVSISGLIGETISRVVGKRSVSEMFQ